MRAPKTAQAIRLKNSRRRHVISLAVGPLTFLIDPRVQAARSVVRGSDRLQYPEPVRSNLQFPNIGQQKGRGRSDPRSYGVIDFAMA